jgi:hypothetical protein
MRRREKVSHKPGNFEERLGKVRESERKSEMKGEEKERR